MTATYETLCQQFDHDFPRGEPKLGDLVRWWPLVTVLGTPAAHAEWIDGLVTAKYRDGHFDIRITARSSPSDEGPEIQTAPGTLVRYHRIPATTADARHPVHIGRILEHVSDWSWFRLDRRAEALQPGDVTRVRPAIEDYPFRTGECRVLGTFDDFVHVERAAWTGIAAIADMDHVYLTERDDRRRPYAPGEKMTDRHPDSVIAQVVEGTIEKRVAHLTRPVQKRRGYEPLAPQPESELVFRLFEQDGALYADTKHGPVKVSAAAALNSSFAGVDLTVAPESLQHVAAPLDIEQAVRQGIERIRATEDRRGPFDYDLPSYAGHLKAPFEQPARPDGFDQHQVDAAKAALLTPAPPRYPRTR